MSKRYNKRKQRDSRVRTPTQTASWEYTDSTVNEPDPSLFIQAYEVDIIRGPQAWSAAASLEVSGAVDARTTGLIRWNPSGTTSSGEGEDINGIWVDRYDARLLLDSIPLSTSAGHAPKLDDADGWSDLPSDAEDTFFFTREEVEDYHRDKRRRTLEKGREDRLRALREEGDEKNEAQEEDTWGGSDEEPDEAGKELMRRTASHLLSSPNPAQLEMRILANHGADRRFAFLRGRWARAWRLAKGRARLELIKEKEQEEAKAKSALPLGGLAGYGDSDEESASGGEDDIQSTLNDKLENKPAEVKDETKAKPGKADSIAADEESVKEARRARAKEWAARRKAQQATPP